MSLNFTSCSIVPDFSGKKQIASPELDQMIKDKKPIKIIDVRESFETDQSGVIDGSIKIPMSIFDEDILKKNKIEKNDTVITVCRSGARSNNAAEYMRQQGYTNVYNLAGGIMTWMSHRLELKK